MSPASMGIVLGLFVVAAPAIPAQQAAPAQPEVAVANPADVESIDAIMKATYDVISGPAGAPRNWPRMRSLFIPGARLGPAVKGPDGKVTARIGSLEDWIAGADRSFKTQHFFEREIGRTTETYGHIAHAFSAYESLRSFSDSVPFDRGINSFQLLYDGTRWWVVSIYWGRETRDNPIPAKYLNKK